MDTRLEIGGRSVILRYTVNAMCAVEDAAGGSLDEALSREFTGVRLLLWGGMLHSQPDLTLAGAGELLDAHLTAGGTLEEVATCCAEALRRAGFFGKAA